MRRACGVGSFLSGIVAGSRGRPPFHYAASPRCVASLLSPLTACARPVSSLCGSRVLWTKDSAQRVSKQSARSASTIVPPRQAKAAAKTRQRKMKAKFYVVARGRQRGIYSTWEQCAAQVTGYPNARHAAFPTLAEARAFLASHPAEEGRAATSSSNPIASSGTTTSATGLADSPEQASEAGPCSSGVLTRAECGPRASRKRQRSPSTDEEVVEETTPTPSFSSTAVVEVYVDGACTRNGQGAVARAGYGGFYGTNDPRNFSLPLPRNEAQTNNRAELRALIHAIQQGFRDGGATIVFETLARPRPSEVTRPLAHLRVHTDSRYVIDGLTKYAKRWVVNGFRLSSKEPVLNQDLWEALIGLRDVYNTTYAIQHGLPTRRYSCGNTLNDGSEGIELLHVRGHSNIHGNEVADQLAVQGANMAAATRK